MCKPVVMVAAFPILELLMVRDASHPAGQFEAGANALTETQACTLSKWRALRLRLFHKRPKRYRWHSRKIFLRELLQSPACADTSDLLNCSLVTSLYRPSANTPAARACFNV